MGILPTDMVLETRMGEVAEGDKWDPGKSKSWDVMYSIGNLINNTGIALCSVKWLLDLW